MARYAHIELGIYDSVETAYSAYAKEKKKNIIDVANQYKTVIPSKLYNALIKYDFKIENDRNYQMA